MSRNWVCFCPCCLRPFEEQREHCWDCGEVETLPYTKEEFERRGEEARKWAEGWDRIAGYGRGGDNASKNT